MSNKILSPDRPLDDPADDRLGYAAFAKQLANSVLTGSPADGLVIALYGEWGTGKSTALNFIVHYLDLHEEPPVVVRFNPWWFAGQEDLLGRFFKQFEATVAKSKLIKSHARKKRVANVLSKFGAAVSAIPVVKDVPYAAEGAKFVGGAAKAAAAALQAGDVVERKADLATALAKEFSRIVVIIDDIDRLVPEEIRQLFRLVKAVGDLPNVTYVLAFDREVAAMAMDRIHGGAGDEYLEKVVQVPFTLPAPDRVQLQKLLFDRLNVILDGTPERLFDQTEWGNVFLEGIDPFIVKPRDVVRLCNSLSVMYPAVRGEVHAVDFVALEVLRIFVPTAYDAIRSNPSRFAGASRERYTNAEDERRFHDAWLQTVTANREAVQSMVVRMFPKLNGVFGNTVYGNDMLQGWRRDLRVCSPEIFPVYFRFGVSPGEVSGADIQATLAIVGDASALASRLRALCGDRRDDGHTRAGALLVRLQDHVSEIPEVSLPAIVEALFDVGDDVTTADTSERVMLDLGDEYRVGWLLRAVLKRLPIADRGTAMRNAFAKGEAVATMLRQLISFSREHGRWTDDGPSDEQMLLHEDIVALENVVALRIKERAASGELWNLAKPLSLIEALIIWGDQESARQLVANRISDDAALLEFLAHFRTKLHTRPMTDRVGRVVLCLDPLRLWGFVEDVDAIEARVRHLKAGGGLTPEQTVTADAFLAGLRARRRGVDPTWIEDPDDDE